MTDTPTRPSRWLRIVYAIWRRRYRWLAVAEALLVKSIDPPGTAGIFRPWMHDS